MTCWHEGLPFFNADELACKGTGVIKLNIEFASMLPALRCLWNKPLVLNSVCRTPKHNKSVGGHPNSMHLTDNPTHKLEGTAAADVRWYDWDKEDRLAFAKLAYSLGFSVGLHESFCHIDWRSAAGLPQACFLYGSWDNSFTVNDVLS